MHQRILTAPALITARAVPQVQPSRGPPPGDGPAPEGGSHVAQLGGVIGLAEDHERIARGLNDVVVHRLFAASLDLHAALGLLGEHRATEKIHHAVDELDQAVRDIRAAIFGSPRAAS